MAQRIGTLAASVERVRLFVLTDGISRVEFRHERATGDVVVTHAIWDIRRLHRCMTSGQRREPIEIDFVQRFGEAIPCLSAQEPGADYAALPGDLPRRRAQRALRRSTGRACSS